MINQKEKESEVRDWENSQSPYKRKINIHITCFQFVSRTTIKNCLMTVLRGYAELLLISIACITFSMQLLYSMLFKYLMCFTITKNFLKMYNSFSLLN